MEHFLITLAMKKKVARGDDEKVCSFQIVVVAENEDEARDAVRKHIEKNYYLATTSVDEVK